MLVVKYNYGKTILSDTTEKRLFSNTLTIAGFFDVYYSKSYYRLNLYEKDNGDVCFSVKGMGKIEGEINWSADISVSDLISNENLNYIWGKVRDIILALNDEGFFPSSLSWRFECGRLFDIVLKD